MNNACQPKAYAKAVAQCLPDRYMVWKAEQEKPLRPSVFPLRPLREPAFGTFRMF